MKLMLEIECSTVVVVTGLLVCGAKVNKSCKLAVEHYLEKQTCAVAHAGVAKDKFPPLPPYSSMA